MKRASKLLEALDVIREWHLNDRPLLFSEENIGLKPGTLINLYRENAMLDAYDRPLPEYTAQNFIEVTTLYISLLACRLVQKKFKLSSRF